MSYAAIGSLLSGLPRALLRSLAAALPSLPALRTLDLTGSELEPTRAAAAADSRAEDDAVRR